MPTFKIDYALTDISVIAAPEVSGVVIRAEVVIATPGGSARSGRYIHLSMTKKGAAALLALLQETGPKVGFPDVPRPSMTFVPPDRDKH